MEQTINEKVLSELQEIKQLALLGAKTVLTVNEAAIILGVSVYNVYRKVSEREIPHYKSPGGKIVYFNKPELESWMMQNKVKTSDEIENQAQSYCFRNKKGGKK